MNNKERKARKLAKRIIKNSDRSSCCNEKLKTTKLGRVMCTVCNKFCKIVSDNAVEPRNKGNYTAGLVWVSVLIGLVIAAYFHNSGK